MTGEEKKIKPTCYMMGGGYLCCNDSSEEEHTCPYHEDVNNDKHFKCTCCSVCEQRCADEI